MLAFTFGKDTSVPHGQWHIAKKYKVSSQCSVRLQSDLIGNKFQLEYSSRVVTRLLLYSNFSCESDKHYYFRV